MTIKEIHNGLEKVGYISTKEIDYAVAGAINCNAPLLIEGAPGAGKTELAKAIVKMLNCPLFRLQMFEGVTAEKVLFDYDYQRQLLTIQTIQASIQKEIENKSINESIDVVKNVDFYGEQFLIKRPVLQAMTYGAKCLLLIDEIDKSSEEIEYILLQFLDEYAISIPQLGTITADVKPIVVLTSNNYRSLSDALKRRCNYLYIENKTKDEMYEIIKRKAMVSDSLADGIASAMVDLQNLNLKQTPSIDEALKFANYLYENFGDKYKDDLEYSLCTLIKNKEDLDRVKQSGVIDKLRKS